MRMDKLTSKFQMALAYDEAQRRVRYQAYVRQGASDQEIVLLRSAWSWWAKINLMGLK